jgi:hypothetical protein
MPADVDRVLLETLKLAHNKGADLYNTGDPAGAFRLYQGALLIVRGFLGHRPRVRRGVDDGLAEVELAGGTVNLKAFRLHEVVEQCRADLKAAVLADRDASDPTPAKVTGRINRGSIPAAGVTVMLTVAGDPVATAAATTGPDGGFRCAVLPGTYVVTAAGAGVQVKFGSVESSPLRLNVVAGLDNRFDCDVG